MHVDNKWHSVQILSIMLDAVVMGFQYKLIPSLHVARNALDRSYYIIIVTFHDEFNNLTLYFEKF